MKHILSLLLILTLLALPACAEAPLTFAPDLAGEYLYPEGSTAEDALYIYRYRYPQIAGESDVAMHINTTYAYTAEDALGFEAPMLASEMQPGDPQKVVDVSYEITCLTEEHLSLRIRKSVTVAGMETIATSGHVIALTGSGAGQIVNLPVFLGILSASETDEWLMNRQTARINQCTREMVWERLQAANGDAYTLYDDLTREEFEASFYPEEDFFLTEEGHLCFFLQAGVVAPEENGEIHVVITVEELLDEM